MKGIIETKEIIIESHGKSNLFLKREVDDKNQQISKFEADEDIKKQ